MSERALGPFLRSLLFLIIAPGTVTVLVPWNLMQARPLEPVAPAIGYVLIAAGWALLLTSFFGFAFVGGGTPAPYDAPPRLVVWGPYRWVRNPIYLALLTILVGESLAFSLALLVYVAVVGAAVYLFVRLYEEPNLAARFGDEYRDYRRRVPGWIPRPPAASPRD